MNKLLNLNYCGQIFQNIFGHCRDTATTLQPQPNTPDNAAVLFLAGWRVCWHLDILHQGMSLKKKALHYKAANCKHMAHCSSFSCQHKVRCLIITYTEQSTTNVSLLLW